MKKPGLEGKANKKIQDYCFKDVPKDSLKPNSLPENPSIYDEINYERLFGTMRQEKGNYKGYYSL